MLSSSIIRSTDNANDSVPRTVPWPLHLGQTLLAESPKEGRKRWRDISSKPNREIRPNCTRALSPRTASFMRFSTSR